jgi:hypothetical protein
MLWVKRQQINGKIIQNKVEKPCTGTLLMHNERHVGLSH